MIKLALFLLKLLHKPIVWWGADYIQLREILSVKLTLDFRRKTGGIGGASKKKGGMLSQLIGFFFIGAFSSSLFFRIDNLMIALAINFALLIVMMAATLINEFTTVLFDEKDNQILLSKPITDKTLLLSRILHIQFFMGYIALVFAVVPFIIVCYKLNIYSGLAYLLSAGLVSWFTLLSTIVLYLILFKLVNIEKVKDIITYFQILIAIVVFGSYQLMTRVFEIETFKNASFSIDWYTFLIAPAWFAGLVNTTYTHDLNIANLLLSLLALLLPLISGWVVIRIFSKGFDRFLSSQGQVSSQKVKRESTTIKTLLKNVFCISRIESEGWNLLTKTTKRDRKFKQGVYPLYGFLVVFVFVMLKPDFSNLAASLKDMSDPNKYVFFVISAFFATTPISMIFYSNTADASWIYQVTPVKHLGHILSGAIKAALVRFSLPIFTFISIPYLYLFGFEILHIILLSIALIICHTLIYTLIQNMGLPFSNSYEVTQKGKMAFKMITSMFTGGIMLGIVYLISLAPMWANIAIIALTIMSIHLLFRRIRKKSYIVL